MKSAHKKAVFGKVIVYAILILIAVVMIIPFLWMLSASIKSDREVFQMNPFVWIPANPKWDNYVKIWTKIPFGRFVGNTVYLTLIMVPFKFVDFPALMTGTFAADTGLLKINSPHSIKNVSSVFLCFNCKLLS